MAAAGALVAASFAFAFADSRSADAQTTSPTATATAMASTAQTWTVQVGGDDPPTDTPTTEAQAFFADPLIIHVGDTVNWKWAGFHTVTFNSGKDPLSLFVPGTTPGELQAGSAFFPVGLAPNATSANYDGSQQVSSGAPVAGPPDQMKFGLTFTRTGTFGYVCSIHPGMRGNIEVREAAAPLPETPNQAIQRGQLTLGALRGKIAADRGQIRTLSAGSVSTVAAGFGDTFGISADVFMPADLKVRRGDTVVWYLPDPFNPHTITFASGGTPPEVFQPRPQPSGPPIVAIPANVASPAGGTSYTGTGYLNSGILTGGSSFAATIDAPPGTYTYFCLIHGSPQGGMMGTITVTG